MIRILILVTMVTGCSWEKQRDNDNSDCYMMSPDGWVLVCGHEDRQRDNEGDLLDIGLGKP